MQHILSPCSTFIYNISMFDIQPSHFHEIHYNLNKCISSHKIYSFCIQFYQPPFINFLGQNSAYREEPFFLLISTPQCDKLPCQNFHSFPPIGGAFGSSIHIHEITCFFSLKNIRRLSFKLG